jgi:hypothetical protein
MSKPNNVISLQSARNLKELQSGDLEYQAMILGMDKLELLEEMVRFQEERTRVGYLTLNMMLRGKFLFKALEQSAETKELRLLTGSYRRHLEAEITDHLRKRSEMP